MTAMTERDAKAAVREFIEANGHPITNGSTYGRLYNATHAWAHSPDGPDALAEFKARVKAAADKFVARFQNNCIECDTAHDWFQQYFGSILAECEPPAPPQPKFAVGQVVGCGGSFGKVTSIHPGGEWCEGVGYRVENIPGIVSQHILRPLTPDEIGPRP